MTGLFRQRRGSPPNPTESSATFPVARLVKRRCFTWQAGDKDALMDPMTPWLGIPPEVQKWTFWGRFGSIFRTSQNTSQTTSDDLERQYRLFSVGFSGYTLATIFVGKLCGLQQKKGEKAGKKMYTNRRHRPSIPNRRRQPPIAPTSLAR